MKQVRPGRRASRGALATTTAPYLRRQAKTDCIGVSSRVGSDETSRLTDSTAKNFGRASHLFWSSERAPSSHLYQTNMQDVLSEVNQREAFLDSSSFTTTSNNHEHARAISIAVEATTVGRSEFHAFVGLNTETQERVGVVSRSAPKRITKSSEWFPIPNDLDASEVAVLLATYLPALRILRHGTTGRRSRMLITCDVVTPLTTALVRLSKVELGYREVYTSTPVASADPFDMVIDLGGQWQSEIPRPKKTRVICCRSLHSVWDDLVERSKLTFTPYASLYDLNLSLASPRQDEIAHLLDLLQRRRIRPEVQQYVSLEELAYMPDSPMSGVVVCEPWKES